MTSEPTPAGDDVLTKCLEMEWQDYFQTRVQTWKTLEIEAGLALGLIAVDAQLESWQATLAAALLVIVASIFGVLITLHHRKVEIAKFNNILMLEKELGVFARGVLPNVAAPRSVRIRGALDPRQSNTALFILRMHLMLIAFAAIYAISRLITG